MKAVFSLVLVSAVGFSLLAALPAEAAEWSERKTGVAKEFNAISCPEPRVCYMSAGLPLVGGTGAVVKTSDGGETFTLLSIPTSDPLRAISCPSAKTCYAVGDFGAFLKTADGGENWEEIQLGTRANRPYLAAVMALSEERVIAAGRDAQLYRTEDGGKNFVRLSLRSTADLVSAYGAGPEVGFVFGNDGTLLKTADGGKSWELLRALRGTGAVTDVSGAGDSALFAVGDFVYRSTDGGETWGKIPLIGSGTQRAVAVLDAQTAYRVESPNRIMKTTDGGASWREEASAEGAVLADITCPSVDYCLAVGSRGTAVRLGTPPEPPPPPPPPPPPEPEPVSSTTPEAEAEPEATPAPAPAPVLVPAPIPSPLIEEPKAEVVPTHKPESPTGEIVSIFTRSLRRGARGEDVRKLQEILAGVAGVYPEGLVTGFFGPATAKAVGRFQERYDIAVPEDAGYGIAGPKTRAKLIEATSVELSAPPRGSAPEPVEPAPAATERLSSADETRMGVPVVIKRTLKKGMRGDEVKRLQEILATDKEVYPDGEVTGYFGPATWKAVGRFQERHGLAEPGEEGYGQVGPKTRAKLIEMAQTQ